MSTELFRVENLCASYGQTQVLFGVTLEIAAGETVALIGSNGAGKSSLLGAVSGIVRIDGGRVLLGERELTHCQPDTIVRAGVVHVPQGRRLFSSLTARENLLMGAYIRNDDGVTADLERVLSLFPRLRERYGTLAGRLSGGEQQMAAIGRALMARPKVLLIDEMSLGLAPVVVDQLLEILSSLRASGISLLIVEQDVQLALEFASRAYVLDTGRVSLHGSAAELLDDSRVRSAYLGV